MTPRTYAIVAGLTVLTGISAVLVAVYLPTLRADPCSGSRVAGGATIGGAFTLIDETGATVTDRDVLARPSLVYFGYTFCPDVCPLDAARNAEAVDILEEMGLDVTPVMISVDPGRDTPAVLAEWTDYIHPRMIGLTGSPEQIKAVGAVYRTYYKVPENPADDYYLVDHMTHTYLMLPDRGFADFFGRDVPAEEMARRVSCFLETPG